MSARTSARGRMMRRRRRAILLSLLVLLTVGWLWRAAVGPSARAGDSPRHRASADGSSPRPSASGPAPTSRPSTAAVASSPAAFAGTGTGRLTVVPGSSRVYGTGPLKRYLVEVEEKLGNGEEAAAFADFVARTLGDPRSWIHGGAMSLQRVDTGPVAFRVTLASPRTVDRFCAPLDTNGYTSCYDGKARAMLNRVRWATGVPWYADDLTTYRQYMLNHEVGHALGHSHAYCPRPGALAPTMQQQTLGMQGCRPNAWPFP